MKILVTGGNGQLGRSLAKRPAVVALPHRELDVTQWDSVMSAIDRVEPTCIINAAAYNAVDAAETNRCPAFLVNRDGAELVARAGAERGVPVIHISSDYVFDGATNGPVTERATPSPISEYGASKLAGEQRVLGAGGMVVRTSWLFAEGGPGFVQTILGLALTRDVIEVVCDQRGCPTWACDLADALMILAEAPTSEILHYCGGPSVTRADLAREIVAQARKYRPIDCRIVPTTTHAGGAKRPASVVLETTRAALRGLPLRRWQTGLADVIASELAS